MNNFRLKGRQILEFDAWQKIMYSYRKERNNIRYKTEYFQSINTISWVSELFHKF